MGGRVPREYVVKEPHVVAPAETAHLDLEGSPEDGAVEGPEGTVQLGRCDVGVLDRLAGVVEEAAVLRACKDDVQLGCPVGEAQPPAVLVEEADVVPHPAAVLEPVGLVHQDDVEGCQRRIPGYDAAGVDVEFLPVLPWHPPERLLHVGIERLLGGDVCYL